MDVFSPPHQEEFAPRKCDVPIISRGGCCCQVGLREVIPARCGQGVLRRWREQLWECRGGRPLWGLLLKLEREVSVDKLVQFMKECGKFGLVFNKKKRVHLNMSNLSKILQMDVRSQNTKTDKRQITITNKGSVDAIFFLFCIDGPLVIFKSAQFTNKYCLSHSLDFY